VNQHAIPFSCGADFSLILPPSSQAQERRKIRISNRALVIDQSDHLLADGKTGYAGT
jgi:hypothetical protein